MITLEQLVGYLNSCLATDGQWMRKLACTYFPYHETPEDHTSIIIGDEPDGTVTAGFVGWLNGLIGRSNRIFYRKGDEDNIVEFGLWDDATFSKRDPKARDGVEHGQPVTFEHTIDFLNECGRLDPVWIDRLVTTLHPGSIALNDTLGIRMLEAADGVYQAGMFGWINGLMAEEGVIRRDKDEAGLYSRFSQATPNDLMLINQYEEIKVEFTPGDLDKLTIKTVDKDQIAAENGIPRELLDIRTD